MRRLPCCLQTVADSKKTVTDEDVLALLGDEVNQDDTLWDLLDLQVTLLHILKQKIVVLPSALSSVGHGTPPSPS